MRKELIPIFGILILSIIAVIAGCTRISIPTNESNVTIVRVEFPINVTNATTAEKPLITNKTKNITKNISNATGIGPSLEINYSKASVIIKATEGDLIQLAPKAYDPDNDTITFYYEKPFNDKGLWQTYEGDAGKYLVAVTASDGKTNTTAYVLVDVKPSNKPPVIECPDIQYTKEGTTFTLDCNIYDIEGDVVTVKYEGWMDSASKYVDYDEAGNHTVVIRASDQNKTSVKTITVIVEDVNRAPIISGLEDITAMEEDIVVLKPKITDPDGDNITVDFSEPFNNQGVWKTKLGDAGEYKVSVVASDGKAVTKKEVKVTINMKNTAPVLKPIPPVIVNEGETVTIPVIAYDRENDPLIVTYSGWMDTSSKKTGYDDAGNYTVIVSVSDGQYTTTQQVQVIVKDVNRPPVFISPA